MAARWNGKEIGDLQADDMIGADREKLDRFEALLSDEDRTRFRYRLSLLVHEESRDLIEQQADLSALKTYVHAAEVVKLKGAIEGLQSAVTLLVSKGEANPSPAQLSRVEVGAVPAPKTGNSQSGQVWTSFIERFFTDRPSVGPRARDSHRQAFRDLLVVIGKISIGDVTKANIKEYADWLRDKPIARSGRTRLGRETIIKMMSHVRSFFGWATESGIIDANPADGVKPRSATREERDLEGSRQAFTKEQLELLFQSPIYTGCESPSRRSAPGSLVLRDERYWFFLLALFSGARIEELAAAPAVLADLEGIPCLDLTGLKGKTNNAPRLIPILPGLQKLGFLQWARSKESDGMLFQGGASYEDWSKGTNRYLRQIGISDPAIVTYSLRHTFRQMLNGSEVLGLSLETGDKIFGHGRKAGRSTGANYGRALSAAEARLFVEKVRAPVDLSHLYPLPSSRAQST